MIMKLRKMWLWWWWW